MQGALTNSSGRSEDTYSLTVMLGEASRSSN